MAKHLSIPGQKESLKKHIQERRSLTDDGGEQPCITPSFRWDSWPLHVTTIYNKASYPRNQNISKVLNFYGNDFCHNTSGGGQKTKGLSLSFKKAPSTPTLHLLPSMYRVANLALNQSSRQTIITVHLDLYPYWRILSEDGHICCKGAPYLYVDSSYSSYTRLQPGWS